MSNRMEGHHEGRSMHQVDPKDGYSMGDCRNDRQRRLLEFLVPIVHPDKPTQVTITIENTLFGALDGGREVDWGIVFQDMAQRLAKGVGKPKPTSICPFLFHLYEGQGLLTADEEVDYQTAKEMAGYRITPDSDSRLGTDEDELAPTPAPSPRPGSSRTPSQRRKSTYRAPSGSPPVRSRGTVKPGSTGNSTEGTATEYSTGRCARVGGEAIRRRRKEPPTGPDSVRVHGASTGSDRLRAWGKTGRNHPNDPVPPQDPGDGWTQGSDHRTNQRE